ncbi:MAG: amidohydrolase [Opitutaceae bacterium]|nr:amidohydrolase [Opitutaceae bacterium]
MTSKPDLILFNGKIATMDSSDSFVEAVAVAGERIHSAGPTREILALKGDATQLIDLRGRTVIPGLHDTHIHVIRGGLNYNLELRWDGVRSLADALDMLRLQVARTPAPQWVRVVGGWSEFQFAERRMPTLEEINKLAPETPVFILHLYCRALLNRAALRACGYDRNTQVPPGCELQRDSNGEPTGLLIARPNALLLYATLAKGPKLPPEYQLNSTRHFMRELNRLGLTSIIDAGGGYQNYPDDYAIIQKLHNEGQLTLRIAYNLFTQRPREELADFQKWASIAKPGQGDRMLRLNGAGEMLVFSAADFEDFLEPRPDLAASLESELKRVVVFLVSNRWPFRLHATYNESISRFLDVFEEVNREVPFDGLHWFFDHAETISQKNIDRVKALGGGIAVQHRMAFQGEYFAAQYGSEAARETPPIRRMLDSGVPVAAGTDATRVANYNPWDSLYWLSTGRTVGGMPLFGDENCCSRHEALRLYTAAGAWFANAEEKLGTLEAGQLADLVVLSKDYFSVADQEVREIQSILTLLGGKVVYASDEYTPLGPGELPVTTDWSPVRDFGGYGAPRYYATRAKPGHLHHSACGCGSLETQLRSVARTRDPRTHASGCEWGRTGFFGGGCDCFAF